MNWLKINGNKRELTPPCDKLKIRTIGKKGNKERTGSNNIIFNEIESLIWIFIPVKEIQSKERLIT